MRTVYIIVIIVILLLGGSLISYRYLQSTTQTLGVELESVEKSISTEKWEIAEKDLNTTLECWDKNKILWTVLLDHQEIDAIDIGINRLDKFIKTQNISLSLGEVSSLKLRLDHIADTEKLNLQNIL
ncbi:DUF4363 family protein [Desulfosporosinus sp. BG]|uniref:DUF4363 family protein n=1 Tax=Desulfosporosinus sp. BG TaxID=1633135 RepID=UPI00083B0836|nr:DUF4363 family protein [Desulfosporosinus sp. BG]ODA41496.1 hypothetical protein DSBG_1772 [Desulfosporosinus sp. BG]